MVFRGKKSRKNAVANVRVVDPVAGTDGAYVDRCISELQNSHSQIVVLCKDSFGLDIGTATSRGIIAGPQIALFDEFTSFAVQFETFRIRAVKYDIYDVLPNSPGTAWFSTFHDEFNAGAQPVFTLANTIDGPDSLLVPPGTGKATLYWRAKGTNEMSFVSDDGESVNTVTRYFGGLRYFIAAGTATSGKYQVVVSALLDFRGRV